MVFALRMPPGNGASIRFLSGRAESQVDFGDKTDFVSSLHGPRTTSERSDVSSNHRNRQFDSKSGRYDGLFITNTM